MVIMCAVSHSRSAFKIAGTHEGGKIEFEAPASEAKKIVQFTQMAIERSFLVKVNIDGKPLTFHASFPQKNAYTGSGEVVKLKLEVPETDIQAILALILYGREKELEMEFAFEEAE